MTDVTTGPDAAALLDRARQMRPLLQQRGAETDKLRRLPDDVVTALRDAGLCRLMVPRRFGGYETSVRTYIEIIAEIGRGCGSTAWVASLHQRVRMAGGHCSPSARSVTCGARIPTPGSPVR